MKLTLIPPGEFDMGSTPEEVEWAKTTQENGPYARKKAEDEFPDELPRHHVRITRPFYLGRCPVTQAEYQRVMGVNPSTCAAEQLAASAFTPPLRPDEIESRERWGRIGPGKDTSQHPVEMVTWNQAMDFCRALSAMPAERAAGRLYRLPTEAEWEYACRAGTTTRWHSGDDEADFTRVAWFNKTSGSVTHPVGEKEPNAWGLYDMCGHVCQWCCDWYGSDYYQQSPVSDPTGPLAGSNRVMRGGNWFAGSYRCRSAARLHNSVQGRGFYPGLRVVVEIVPQEPSATAAPVPPLAVAPFDAPKAKQHQEAWAKHLNRPVEETNSIGMKLTLIPPGEFEMGSTPEEIAWALEKENANEIYVKSVSSEGPRHRVRITRPFYCGMYQVTQAEYEKVMGVNPSAFTSKPMAASAFQPPLPADDAKNRPRDSAKVAGSDTSRYPVETVSWDDAVEFCRKLSATPAEQAAKRVYRLPTEAKWEYACRAGTTTRWSCGDDEAGVADVAWFNNDRRGKIIAGGRPHPVGQKTANAWGLYDMHGNVWQWCADAFRERYYRESPPSDPVASNPTSTAHVLRGGAWRADPMYSRSAFRYCGSSPTRLGYIGFRVVVDR
jgi:formylglycine-generating enzyme required for sulfatase activity